MIEDPTGHRMPPAPSEQVADHVGATYRVDEVRVGPVVHVARGGRRQVVAGPLECARRVGSAPATPSHVRITTLVQGALTRDPHVADSERTTEHGG